MSRILVIEDDPAILRGLADNLKFEAHEVLTAADGEAGYRLIREQRPDLIILDLMLPKLNGYEVCRKLRGEGVTIPILMLTAKSQEADRVTGLDLGANDYLTKPFSVRELLARIRAILRQRQAWLGEHNHFDQEVRTASDVQQRLFPQTQPSLTTLDYVGFCQPARGVGGDYYDFLDLGASRLGLLVADVSGKGISAALLMASLHASIHSQSPGLGDRCAELAARVNALLYEATDAQRFATMFYAVYDDATRLLTYVNAGHEHPLLMRAGEPDCKRLDSGTLPLGIFPSINVTQQSVCLEPGEWLVIFSDGVTEAFNERGEMFGQERLLEVIVRNQKGSAAEMRDAILSEVTAHSSGQPQSDDLTLIVARVR